MKKILGAVLLIVLVLLSGCGQTTDLVKETSNIVYDADSLTYMVCGKEYANLFEYGESPNGRYSIYVASQLGKDPEAWLYDSEEGGHRQLTDNGYFIEHDVHADDNGNWAAALTETSNSVSKILYNGETVVENGLQNRSLCFVDSGLFFAAYDKSARTSSICLYDTERGEVHTIAAGMPVATGECVTYGENAVLLEAYDYETKASTVLEARLDGPDGAWQIESVTDGNGNSFLRTVPEGVRIEQVTGDDNAMYLFNAHYWLEKYQNCEPWAGSTDFAGRISWNESYRLIGMLKLLEKTGDAELRTDIANAVHRLIATRKAAYRESGRDTDRFLYLTKKYSLDLQSELSYICNGMIYWAMLRAANAGYLPEEDYYDVISMVEAAFQYYEEDWDDENGFYRFRKGSPFLRDGILVPFNQQNSFGLCLIELWKATGDTKYQARCFALAESFAKEIEIAENGQAIWRYLPQRDYDGWSEADGISVNTPALAPITDPPYEDASHGSVNAAFIFSFAEAFGEAVFQQDILQGVRQTAEGICTAGGLSDTVYPLNTDGTFFNCLWMLWMQEDQGNSTISQYALTTNLFAYVEFDAQASPYLCASLIDPAAGGELRISSTLFSESGREESENFDIVYADVPKYAERFSPLWLP